MKSDTAARMVVQRNTSAYQMSRTPRVCIIIPTRNGYHDTRECLASIRETGYANASVTVVDNASWDSTVCLIREEFPEVHVLANESNVGFAAAVNIGIRWCLTHDSPDFFLLLNNDTLLDSASIETLVQAALTSESVGIVGPKIYWGATGTLWSAGGFIDPIRVRGIHFGHGRPDGSHYSVQRSVGFVSGCCMLVRRSVVDTVGELPDWYFFGGEEWQYCYDVRQAGYTILYEPNAQIVHKVGRSHHRLDPGFLYNTYVNRFIFARRLHKGLRFTAWAAGFSFYILLALPWRRRLADSEGRQNWWTRSRLALRIVADGWRRRGLDGASLADIRMQFNSTQSMSDGSVGSK